MPADESAPAAEHLRIPPWLRPVARRGGEVQFGVSPGGPIVTGVTEAEADVLALLDGTLPLRRTFQLAAEAGIAASRWRSLLDLLDRLGVLEPSRDRQQEGQVLLDGRGPLVDEVAGLLQHGGLDIAVRAPAEAEPVDTDATTPALVVLMESAALDPCRGDLWQRLGTPHLPVLVTGPHATVGPLITPLAAGPCLWCLDLHRSDRDGDWPTVMARLCAGNGTIVPAPGPPTTGDPLLAQLVSACIGLLVRGHLDGRRTPTGVSVDIHLPWPRMDHRRWSVHPHCWRHADARVA